MRVAAVNPENTNIAQLESLENVDLRKLQATALIATNDPEIHGNMLLAGQKVSVCFCGFWLLDGTYRDVVRHLKLRRAEIPAVIVCAPSCPHDYRDYLAALNISAFDFICHPYQKSDIERILNSAVNPPLRPPSPIPPISGIGAAGLRKAS
jgi:DNA-binding NtrC family response regulator